MTCRLNIEQINMRGLANKEKILGDHLRDFRTDIVLLTELQPIGFRNSNQSFDLTGWNMYMESLRCAILVNNALPIQAKHVKLGIDEEALAKADYEKHPYATSVRLRDPVSKKSLLIVCVYLSPNLRKEDILNIFEVIDKTRRPEEMVVLGGDFNAHQLDFGSYKTDPKGEAIKYFLETAPYKLLNTGEGTSSKKWKSVLDLTFVSLNTYNSASEWRVRKPKNWKHYSDHWPITFKLTLQDKKLPEPQEVWNLKVKEEKWEVLEQYAEDTVKFNPAYTAEQNAFSVTFFIVQAATDAIGTVYTNPTEHPWWNKKLDKIKKKKKSLQRKLTPWLERNKPNRFLKLKCRWNNTKHRLERRLEARKLQWNEKINCILSSPTHKELFWKIVNNPVRRPSQTIPPLKDKRGTEHDDIETKLQLLLDTYMSPPQPKQATEMEKGNYKYRECTRS